jgi:hypothetical protein
VRAPCPPMLWPMMETLVVSRLAKWADSTAGSSCRQISKAKRSMDHHQLLSISVDHFRLLFCCTAPGVNLKHGCTQHSGAGGQNPINVEDEESQVGPGPDVPGSYLCDVVIHSPVFPLVYSCIDVEARSHSKIPAVSLSFNVEPPRRSVWSNKGNAVLCAGPLGSCFLNNVFICASQSCK